MKAMQWVMLLVTSALLFSSSEATASQVECKPSTAVICGHNGCVDSPVGNTTISITNNQLVRCTNSECKDISVLAVESTGHWIWVSGASFYVSVSKDTNTYVSSVNIGLGALVEHGTCLLR